MKKISSLLLVACLGFAGVAQAKNENKGKGKGHGKHGGRVEEARGNGNSAAAFAPGRRKKAAGVRGASEFAPGHLKKAAGVQSAAAFAPGRVAKRPELQTRAQSFRGRDYEQVLTAFNRAEHPADYWRSRYQRIEQVNGGYYYLENGYWFPAFGYRPGYTRFVYDVPVYAYNGLPPNVVVRNVQLRLREFGYYAGPPDGMFGPITRGALRAFQADYGLRVTGAVDEATLYTLGL